MRPPTIDDIVQATAEAYGLRYGRLLGKEQVDEVAKPRYVAMYLSRLYTRHSYEEIAHFFNRKNHTSARTAFETISVKYQKNMATIEKVDTIVHGLEGAFTLIAYNMPSTIGGFNKRSLHNARCPKCGGYVSLTGKCKGCQNEEAWSTFIKDTIRGYFSVALEYTRSQAEAEDIVWGVYARLLEKNYLRENLPTVGLRAIHNASINHLKRQAFRRIDYNAVVHPPPYPPTDKRIDSEIVMDSLSMILSKKERGVFVSYISGMSYKDVAVAYDIEVGTVKSHVHRSRNKIKNEYPEYANKK